MSANRARTGSSATAASSCSRDASSGDASSSFPRDGSSGASSSSSTRGGSSGASSSSLKDGSMAATSSCSARDGSSAAYSSSPNDDHSAALSSSSPNGDRSAAPSSSSPPSAAPSSSSPRSLSLAPPSSSKDESSATSPARDRSSATISSRDGSLSATSSSSLNDEPSAASSSPRDGSPAASSSSSPRVGVSAASSSSSPRDGSSATTSSSPSSSFSSFSPASPSSSSPHKQAQPFNKKAEMATGKSFSGIGGVGKKVGSATEKFGKDIKAGGESTQRRAMEEREKAARGEAPAPEGVKNELDVLVGRTAELGGSVIATIGEIGKDTANSIKQGGKSLQSHAKQESAHTRVETTLPPGWERRRTRSGRAFFLDHNTKTTHWNPPPPPSSSVDCSSPTSPPSHENWGHSLPEGWQAVKTRDGRVLYIDHLNRTTSWNPPPRASTISASPSHPKIPSLSRSVSLETPPTTTAATATQPPTLASTAPTMATSSSSSTTITNRKTPQPRLSASVGEDRHSVPVPQKSIAEQLPFGWEEMYLPNGRPIYIDHRNKSTSWTPPALDSDGGCHSYAAEMEEELTSERSIIDDVQLD